MLTCRRTLQIQLQLNPRQGSVNDCDPAVLRFTAHAELEASCASGFPNRTKPSSQKALSNSRTFSPCSHSELLPPIPQLQATKAGKFRGPRCLVLLLLSYSLAAVLEFIFGALDGRTGISKS